MTPLRIIFAGTPDFAARHLQALLDAGHQVVAVYSQPDSTRRSWPTIASQSGQAIGVAASTAGLSAEITEKSQGPARAGRVTG